jgi:molybdopterin-guanine dinucleotide biosynthesis protein A
MFNNPNPSPIPNALICILAGGASSRMGSDKALLDWGGQPLLAHALETARLAAARVVISGSTARYSAFGAPCIEDDHPGRGPLEGIVSVFRKTHAPRVLFLACDMPFVTSGFMTWLWQRSLDWPFWTVPQTEDGRLESTCAVYTDTLMPAIEAALARGDYKIARALADAPTRLLSAAALHENGFDPAMFRNVNSPEDYAGALRSSPHVHSQPGADGESERKQPPSERK